MHLCFWPGLLWPAYILILEQSQRQYVPRALVARIFFQGHYPFLSLHHLQDVPEVVAFLRPSQKKSQSFSKAHPCLKEWFSNLMHLKHKQKHENQTLMGYCWKWRPLGPKSQIFNPVAVRLGMCVLNKQANLFRCSWSAFWKLLSYRIMSIPGPNNFPGLSPTLIPKSTPSVCVHTHTHAHAPTHRH